MRQVNVHYTPEDIFNQSFPIQHKGYNPLKVDTFLDMVIHDYKTFYHVTDQLYKKIKNLENDQSGMYVNLQKQLYQRKQQNERLAKYNSDILRKMHQKEQLVNIIAGTRIPSSQDWQYLSNRLSNAEHIIYNS